MNSLLKSIAFFLLIGPVFIGATYAQRSNYTEDDIATMNIQKSICESIMQLLEEKNVDSALHYFIKKDKATKAILTEISNTIQQYKSTYTFEVSPDTPNDTDNHYYCKYTADEGVTVKYRVDFIMPRVDENYKVLKIVQHNNKPAPKQKTKK